MEISTATVFSAPAPQSKTLPNLLSHSMKHLSSVLPTSTLPASTLPTTEALLLTLAQSPEPDGRSDPLISQGTDIAIYIGIAILIIAIAFVIKSLNYRVEYAIFFALALAGVLIAVILSI